MYSQITTLDISRVHSDIPIEDICEFQNDIACSICLMSDDDTDHMLIKNDDEEVMSLSVSDILLLDKKVDEPIQLIIEDRMLFRGRAAKSVGNYAAVITETTYNAK